MTTDVTLVIYRDLRDSTLELIHALGKCRVDRVWILASGCSAHTISQIEEASSLALEAFRLIARPDNLGFAGGHNYLMGLAFDEGAKHCLLVNPDLIFGPEALDSFISSASHHIDGRSLHAPQLTLGESWGGRQVVDTNGIVWSRARRHFDAGQGEPFALNDDVQSVAGLSGACLLVDSRTFDWIVLTSGYFFDPLFLAYREDADLSLRVRELGGRCLLHPSDGFHHDRGSRNGQRLGTHQKRLSVRNRFLLLFRMRDAWRAFPLGLVRDVLVVAASTVSGPERQGLADALRLRVVMRSRGRVVKGRRVRSLAEAAKPDRDS